MIGIIGGTGLYSIEGMKTVSKKTVVTPFGKPSAPIVTGIMEGGTKVAFLPRHGADHSILPGEINFRANIWALKSIGVRQVISVSATGSLVQEIAPGSLALPSQYFDWTRGRREPSFFGKGMVGHISTAEPVCPVLAAAFENACRSAGIPVHTGKTYACVEGPRLGTRAESFFLKSAGCHLVGMTNVPEAFLAREAGLCYCTVAVATDYDCWLDDPSQHANIESILALYKEALGKVRLGIQKLLSQGAAGAAECKCAASLDGAVLTHAKALTPKHKKILAFLKQR
ncbi:MAG: 5'-methylthioadenosine phosphorylase [Bdellovibrionales bacterium RIFOXYD1_FULL_53_11]|nr:MAG: 5'-methylthioadenosine phosphorylase [Bdellovibrionales bacterium RIFOXYD1_FULL_53_11]